MVLVMECSAQKEYIMRMRLELLTWETKFLGRLVKVTVEDLSKSKMLKEDAPWWELFQVNFFIISKFYKLNLRKHWMWIWLSIILLQGVLLQRLD